MNIIRGERIESMPEQPTVKGSNYPNRPLFFLVAAALSLGAPSHASAQATNGLQGVANTTLKMRQVPQSFGYTTKPAFGNLTFTTPVAVRTPAGETNRVFVVEQGGRIFVITNLAAPTS